jgi:subtilisin-like proprotein convertase family protein
VKPWNLFRRSRSPAPRATRGRLRLECLEDRTLLSVNVITTAPGVTFSNSSSGAEPPDPIVAAGPTQVVEMVNSDMRVTDQNGNILATTPLTDVFAPLGPGSFLSDPGVMYDQQAKRFVISVLDVNVDTNTDDLLFAVSDNSTATGGFTEQQRISFTNALDNGDLADYPRMGWNNDAYVYTLNMFDQTLTFNHVDVVTINKASVLDKNPNTFTDTIANAGSNYSTLVPAVMHNDPNSTKTTGDDPMWLVSATASGNGNTIDVVKETHTLSAAPSFKQNWVTVNPYQNPPDAAQPGGTMTTNDSRMLNAEWQNNQLVADHTIGTGGSVALARWYQFNTGGATPALVQQGIVTHGTGVSTYMPAIAVNPNGSLGMTFMESSATENVSMYVTGQAAGLKTGVMQTPVLVQAGATFYSGSRSGDFSGITTNPNGDNSFWAASEYTTSDTLWGTAIAHFNLLTPAGPRVLASTPNGTVSGSVSSITFTFSTPMNTSSFSTKSIDSFTGPGGNLLSQVTSFQWTDSTHLKVNFKAQTAKGSYSMVIGPNILDTSGHAMDQNGNGTRGEVPADEYPAHFAIAVPQTYTDSTPAAINAGDVTFSNLTINQAVTISSATVQLNITYPNTGDLLIDLISPNNTDVTLSEFEGTGANFQGTLFSDTATVPISAGSSPFKGTYQPENPLSALAGQSTAGTWTLQIGNFGGSTGTLTSWSLIVLSGQGGGGLIDARPAPVPQGGPAPAGDASGSEGVPPLPAGNHLPAGGGAPGAPGVPSFPASTDAAGSLAPVTIALVRNSPAGVTDVGVFPGLPAAAGGGTATGPQVFGPVTLPGLATPQAAPLSGGAAPENQETAASIPVGDGARPQDQLPEQWDPSPRPEPASPEGPDPTVPAPARQEVPSDALFADEQGLKDLGGQGLPPPGDAGKGDGLEGAAAGVLLVLALGGWQGRLPAEQEERTRLAANGSRARALC